MAGRALCVLVGWMAMFTASTAPVASTAATVTPPVTPGPDICALVPDASCRPIIPKLCYQGPRHSVIMVNNTDPLNPCAWQGKASVKNGTCASYGFPHALGKDPVYNTTLWSNRSSAS